MDTTKKFIIDKQYFDNHISDIQAAIMELQYGADVQSCINTIDYECKFLYTIYGIQENLPELIKEIS